MKQNTYIDNASHQQQSVFTHKSFHEHHHSSVMICHSACNYIYQLTAFSERLCIHYSVISMNTHKLLFSKMKNHSV